MAGHSEILPKGNKKNLALIRQCVILVKKIFFPFMANWPTLLFPNVISFLKRSVLETSQRELPFIGFNHPLQMSLFSVPTGEMIANMRPGRVQGGEQR